MMGKWIVIEGMDCIQKTQILHSLTQKLPNSIQPPRMPRSVSDYLGSFSDANIQHSFDFLRSHLIRDFSLKSLKRNQNVVCDRFLELSLMQSQSQLAKALLRSLVSRARPDLTVMLILSHEQKVSHFLSRSKSQEWISHQLAAQESRESAQLSFGHVDLVVDLSQESIRDTTQEILDQLLEFKENHC